MEGGSWGPRNCGSNDWWRHTCCCTFQDAVEACGAAKKLRDRLSASLGLRERESEDTCVLAVHSHDPGQTRRCLFL